MTKERLGIELMNGKTLEEIFKFVDGQECLIYKADEFELTDDIVYIPDIDLHEIIIECPLSDWEIENVLDNCYTGNDFLIEAKENKEIAESLFWYVDWQTPDIYDWAEGYDEEQFYHDYGINMDDYLDGNEEFEVEITETYKRTIKIKSKDKDRAYELVDEMINNGEIDLPCDGEEYDYSRDLFVNEVK